MEIKIGERLNVLRKSQGMSAQNMADAIGVALRTYRFYESDYRQPSYDILVKIADTLDVSLDYLLSRDEFLARHAD